MHPPHNPAAPCVQQGYLAIASVLPLQVVICHTRKWWYDEAGSRDDGKPLDFKYEVHTSSDDWTIGGQRKGHFSAKVSFPGDVQPFFAYKFARQMKIGALQSSSCHNV